MNTDNNSENNSKNYSDQDINERALRVIFSTDNDGDDMPDIVKGKSDLDFLTGVKAGLERKARTRRLLVMIPVLVLSCILAFILIPNVPLLLDALQVSLPESASLLLADLGNSMEFKLGMVLLFGLGLPWLMDKLEQTSS